MPFVTDPIGCLPCRKLLEPALCKRGKWGRDKGEQRCSSDCQLGQRSDGQDTQREAERGGGGRSMGSNLLKLSEALRGDTSVRAISNPVESATATAPPLAVINASNFDSSERVIRWFRH